MGSLVLKVEKLSHSFRDGAETRVIFNDVNIEFETGKVYALLGYSGSGKTTLLSFLAGLDEPLSGEIKYNGTNIKDLGYIKYRRNNSSIVFQEYNLINYLDATKNVLTAMEITDNTMPKDLETVANNLLDFVGIGASKASRKVKALSGGEKQRVAIARSLATNTNLIFADEPTGNLDSETELEVINILKEIATKYDKCVIIVTHSNEVARICDEVFRLKNEDVVKEYKENIK